MCKYCEMVDNEIKIDLKHFNKTDYLFKWLIFILSISEKEEAQTLTSEGKLTLDRRQKDT